MAISLNDKLPSSFKSPVRRPPPINSNNSTSKLMIPRSRAAEINNSDSKFALKLSQTNAHAASA